MRSKSRTVTKSNGVKQYRLGKLKAQTMDASGYRMVSLNKHGKQKKISVHKLVAAAFCDGYFDGAEVNHKDFNKLNNSAENLEWISHAENIEYSRKNGRNKERAEKMKGSGNPNYHNHTLKEKYAQNKKLAKEKQSRPGSQNGRATPIQMIKTDGSALCFDYILQCAKYLICNNLVSSRSATYVANCVSGAINNENQYAGASFIKV